MQAVGPARHEVLEGVLVGRAEVDAAKALGGSLAVVQQHLVLPGDGEARAGIPDAEGTSVGRVTAGVERILPGMSKRRMAKIVRQRDAFN